MYYITLLFNKTQSAYRSATERDTLIEKHKTKRTQAIDSIKNRSQLDHLAKCSYTITLENAVQDSCKMSGITVAFRRTRHSSHDLSW